MHDILACFLDRIKSKFYFFYFYNFVQLESYFNHILVNIVVFSNNQKEIIVFFLNTCWSTCRALLNLSASETFLFFANILLQNTKNIIPLFCSYTATSSGFSCKKNDVLFGRSCKFVYLTKASQPLSNKQFQTSIALWRVPE